MLHNKGKTATQHVHIKTKLSTGEARVFVKGLPYLIADFLLILLVVTRSPKAEEDDGDNDEDQEDGNNDCSSNCRSVGS